MRTPLNGITGYSQILLLDDTLTEKQKDGIYIIQESGEHLLTLINEILDLSKIEAGRMENVLIEFDLVHTISRVAESFKVRAEQKGIAFITDFDSELPYFVKADEKKNRQILTNLLGNTIKFTDEGSVKFKVQNKGNAIRFSIEDTGIGIPRTSFKEIFQSFRQASSKLKNVEGTGLGLAISYRLAEVMGSKLKVKSKVGAGSTFWFDLNLFSVQDVFSQTSDYNSKFVGFKGDKPKIIVVDDLAENRTILNDMLTPLGFEIFEAQSGMECLDLIQQYSPKVALIDLRMEGMDGIETIQKVRELPNCDDIFIITISASAFNKDRLACIEAGSDVFLSKPFKLDDLLTNLKKTLDLEFIEE